MGYGINLSAFGVPLDNTGSGGSSTFDTDTIVTTENLSLIEKLVQIGVTINDMSSVITDTNGDIITSGA